VRGLVWVVSDGGVGRRCLRGMFSRRCRLVVPLALLAMLAAAWGAEAAVSGPGATKRVSGADDAQPGAVAISANGRYVAFVSLRKGYLGSVQVADRKTGRTTIASVAADGGFANASSGRLGVTYPILPVGISADGRYVGFTSWASNLVGEVRDIQNRAFVRDMQAGVTTEVGDGDFSAMSADGRTVAFTGGCTTTNNTPALCLRDMVSGVMSVASLAPDGGQANGVANSSCGASPGGGFGVSLSADGRFVAFSLCVSNLVPGATSAQWGVFVRDLLSGVTSLVSVAGNGGPANGDSGPPSISASGRYVAFASDATNLVDGDTNQSTDVFVRDRVTGKTTEVSVASSGRQGWSAGYPVDDEVAISGDGRFVAFVSDLNGLVHGDENDLPDVFVHDRQTGVTSLVSVARTGGNANGASLGPIGISAHGRDVAFGSGAGNLVSRPTLTGWGIFVRDRLAIRH